MKRRTVRFVDSNGAIREVHFDATGRDIHIDAPLSEILINYRPAGSIAEEVFPVVPVMHQSDVFYKFDQADLWRTPDTIRAPLTAAKMADFNVSSDTYYARNFALSTGISIEDMSNADEVLNLRETKGLFIRDLLSLDQELRVANLVFGGSNVGTATGPLSGSWDDHADSDPVFDIDTNIDRMRDARGYIATHAIIGWKAWRHLKRNDNLRGLIFPAAGGGAGPGVPTLSQLSEVVGIPKIMIGGMMRNTAAEGLGLTLADLWGPHMLIYYRPERPSKEQPTYGYTFRWRRPGLPDMQVENLGFDNRIKGEIFDIGMYQDEKVVDAQLAILIQSVSAT